MINPVSGQSNISSMYPAQTSTNVANTAAPAVFSPMKERLESAGADAKENLSVRASEVMHNLANAETSQLLSSATTNSAIVTQAVTQQWSSRLWTGGS